MKRLWLTLIVFVLIAVGAVEYSNRQLFHFPFSTSSQPQQKRVINNNPPNLKTPNDASQETHQVITKGPVHYHGYFNSRNKAAYLSAIRADALKDINHERTERGMPALKINHSLNRIAAMRSVQADQNFSHYDNNNQVLACVDAVKTHFMPNYLQARAHISECLSEQAGDIDNTAGQVTNTAVKGMIYHDAGSHWGHRKILLDFKNRYIGITAHVDRGKNDKVVIAYDLYQ